MLKLFRENLRVRLWVAFIVVLIVPTILLTVNHIREFSAALREEVRLKQSRILEAEAAEIETTLNEANADVLFLSQSVEIRRYANALPENRLDYIPDAQILFQLFLLQYGGRYKSACLIDANGHETLCVNNEDQHIYSVPVEELLDRSESSYFHGTTMQGGISTGQPLVFVSEAEWHLHSGNVSIELVSHYATRLLSDSGRLVGVLVLDLRLTPLFQRATTQDTSETVYVLDAEGNYLYHSNPDYGEDNPSDANPEQADLQLTGTSGELFGAPRTPNDLFSFHKIKGLGQQEAWTLIHRQPLDVVMRPINKAWQTSVAIAAVLMLLASLFALWVTSRVTRPIYHLTRSVTALQSDVWTVDIAPPRDLDEVGRLTLAFIQMRHKIQELIASLEERIQHLEATESALATSEQKYRSFVEQAFEGIRLVDQNGIIQEWNPSSERITGISADDAIGKPLVEIQKRLIPGATHSPEVFAQMEQELSEYFPDQEQKPPRYIPSRRIHRSDGSIRYIDNVIFPIVAGKQIYYGGIVRDITAQKEDQDRLEQHVHKLEAMQRIAVAVGGSIKLDEVLDLLLDQLANLIPYKRATIMLMEAGQLKFSKWRGLSEDGSWRAIETLISPQEYMKNQGLPVIINDVQTNDDWKIYTPGDELIHSWLGIPLIHRDVLLGVLNLDHHDIGFFTEDYSQLAYAVAQQAGIAIANAQLFENLEELVRTRTQELAVEQERSDIMLRYIADAIVFTDDKGYILYVNPAWEKLNGYTLDEVQGRRSNLIQSGETPLAVYQAMWNTITSGKTWKGDLKNRRKDGSLYVAELVIVPVHSAEGNIQHYVGVQRDVTALRELDALKERFVADAAHDLGNPVAVLNTSLYMLRHAPAQLEQRLPILEYQVKRLDALVKDLLTISQLDREVELVDASYVPFVQLVAQIVQGQQLLAAQKQIHLTADLPETTPPLTGDVQAIERVIVNLVANALTYTPDGGQVHVQVSRQQGEIIFSVKDTGIGISPTELTRIFDRFYRTPSARRKTAGTGLGLPIVKKIVELHGGRIEVESEEGKGSEFRVYFPIKAKG